MTDYIVSRVAAIQLFSNFTPASLEQPAGIVYFIFTNRI